MIATHLTAEDRQALRLASSRLRQYLVPTAPRDALAIRIERVITRSSLLRVGEAVRSLAEHERAPLLARLASRLQHFPLCLQQSAYSDMLAILEALPHDHELAPLEALATAYRHHTQRGSFGSLGSMAMRTTALNHVPGALVRYAQSCLPTTARMDAYTALARHDIWAERHPVATPPDALREHNSRNRALHIVRRTLGDAFRAFPAGMRATLWRDWLRETLALPEEDRKEPLSALTGIAPTEVWPELLQAAEAGCANDKATIYAGIASRLPNECSDEVAATLQVLTDGMLDLPLALRIPVLVSMGQALGSMRSAPASARFLHYVGETVPAELRCPILLGLVSCPWRADPDARASADANADANADAAFMDWAIRATRELPADHQDEVLAGCIEATSDNNHTALDAAFDFASRVDAPAHRHRMVAALAAKRRWILATRAGGTHSLTLRDMVAGLESRHRWQVIGWLVWSAYGSPSQFQGMDNPSPNVSEHVLAALDAEVAALPAVYRVKLMKMLVSSVLTSASPAWQWAYRTAVALPPADRAEVLLALSQPWQDHYRRGQISWGAATQLLAAAAEVPSHLRAAVVAGAETMMIAARDRADPLSYLYSLFKLQRQWQSLPDADRYPRELRFW